MTPTALLSASPRAKPGGVVADVTDDRDLLQRIRAIRGWWRFVPARSVMHGITSTKRPSRFLCIYLAAVQCAKRWPWLPPPLAAREAAQCFTLYFNHRALPPDEFDANATKHGSGLCAHIDNIKTSHCGSSRG